MSTQYTSTGTGYEQKNMTETHILRFWTPNRKIRHRCPVIFYNDTLWNLGN